MAEFDAVARDERRIHRKDVDGLSLYVYSTRGFQRRDGAEWDRIQTDARGIVFRRDPAELVALPFPKFFNLGETEDVRRGALPDEPVVIQDKLDGTLVIMFYDGQRWRAATKGSLDGPHATWAAAWLAHRIPLRRFDPFRGHTLLFEAIYPSGTFADDLIVDYGDRTDMVLLAAYATDLRAEVRPASVDRIAADLGVGRPRRIEGATLDDVSLMCREDEGCAREGVVVQFQGSGLRVKLKTTGYRRAARALSGSTIKAFWEAMAEDGKVGRSVLAALPPHRRDDAEAECAELEQMHRDLMARADALASSALDLAEGRERGQWVQSHAGPLQGAVFGLLAGNRTRAGAAVRRVMRPKHDRIPPHAREAAYPPAGGSESV